MEEVLIKVNSKLVLSKAANRYPTCTLSYPIPSKDKALYGTYWIHHFAYGKINAGRPSSLVS